MSSCPKNALKKFEKFQIYLIIAVNLKDGKNQLSQIFHFLFLSFLNPKKLKPDHKTMSKYV